MAPATLSLDNPVFAAFAFYASVLLAKVFLVVFGIVFYRLRNQVFPSPEDYKRDPKGEKPSTIRVHPDVERMRRMHQNDLENIVPFVLLGLLYVLIGPPAKTAILVFRIFTGARILYTLFYFLESRLRGPIWVGGVICNVFMAVNIIMACKHAL